MHLALIVMALVTTQASTAAAQSKCKAIKNDACRIVVGG
jgi:hypothetical protein